MMKRRRAFAVAMAVAMLVFMILSSAYIAREAGHGHDCVGEGCPICQFIAGIERLRGSLGGALLILLAACLAAALNPVRHAQMAADVPVFCPLTAQKIRLND